MTEKMTIEKAREILKIANDPLAHLPITKAEAFGFIAGYESHQAEIEELKKQNGILEGRLLSSEAAREALIKIKEKVRCPMCGEIEDGK